MSVVKINAIHVPEEYEGVATERGVVTNSLVAEALAYGDMGLALPILAPSGVAVGALDELRQGFGFEVGRAHV